MTVSELHATEIKTKWPVLPRSLVSVALLFPALAFLTIFLVLPSLILLGYSVLTQSQGGDISLPFTAASYQRLIVSPAYRNVIMTTLRVASLTALFTSILAYPLAMVIAYGRPFASRATTIMVVAPLVVSVIVRTYGWQLLLGNNSTGVLNWILETLGTGKAPVKVLYTDWATIIASVHVFLPLMVLPLSASLGRINPSLNEAARVLGAPAWRAFLRITLPLSVPGLIAGLTIVFSLTAASYVTPQMVGGSRGLMLGVLLEQQINTAFDWPMAAAIAVVMLMIALLASVGVAWLEGLVARRRRRRGGA